VKEHLGTLIRSDEAETLVVIKKFDFAGRHVNLFRKSNPLVYKAN
jgi:hypothetical protein